MSWISVNDRIPEDRVYVLVYNGSYFSITCYLSEYGYHEWSHDDDEYDYKNITHWMILPEPPTNLLPESTKSVFDDKTPID
jgi:hypothetical protein